jgi:SAM-dependent methyltransferase
MFSSNSAISRLYALWRDAGTLNLLTIVGAAVDDRYLKSFDRRYRIQTSGFIELEETSFERSRLRDATLYGPVNGWAFRHLLRTLNLPQTSRFVDFGSGLGRACIIAAEYGFARVTGVELTKEFCVRARQNIAGCRPPGGHLSPITIVEMDVLAYCEQCDDDVFFMFRPFSQRLFETVLDAIEHSARRLEKSILVIYTERVALQGSFVPILAARGGLRPVRLATYWGQAFFVYECRP